MNLSLWKKAVSVTATATLLASLLATAAVGTVAANSTPQALNVATCAPAACTQVAATGTVTISSTADTFLASTNAGGGQRKLTISGAGATFIAAHGNFALQTGTNTPTAPEQSGTGAEFYLAGEVYVPTGTLLVPANDNVVAIGATAGTATITEWVWTGANGTASANKWVPDGNTYTLTFTAATSYQVSASASTVSTVTYAADCSGTALTAASANAGANAASVCVSVVNTSGGAVSGASVTVTMTPYGTLGAALQTTSATETATAGTYTVAMNGSGLAGVSTISVSVTYLGITTALAPATFTWTGTPNTLTLALKKFTGANPTNVESAFYVQATDAAGNALPQSGATLTASVAGLTFADLGTVDAAGYYDALCTTATEAAITVTATIASPALTSNTVTFVCNPGAAATLVLKPTNSSIPAGGSTTFTVTGKDAAGNPIADGTVINAVASAGAVIGSNIGTASTTNGVATFTYLAVNSNGPVTLTAVEPVNSGLTASGTVGVGQPAAGAAAAASAAGVTTSGPFTTATKVIALGKYATIKFSGLTAGATVKIMFTKKNSAGVWAAVSALTSRVANSSGVVYFYVKSASAAWESFSAGGSNWVQIRWR